MTHHIDDYDFGRLVVGGTEYRTDVILLPGRGVERWHRLEGHRLAPRDMDAVAAAAPAVLVVGTGAHGVLEVPEKTTAFLRARGIRVEAYPTRRAIARYNELAAAGEHVAAALHLTC